MKVAVDVVLFSYIEKTLNVLLIKRNIEPSKGKLTIPGVLLGENENAETAAIRALNDKASINLTIDYIEQLYTFTSLNRDPRERVISISYFGLIDSNNLKKFSNIYGDEVNWIDVSTLQTLQTKLGFDHNLIFNIALKRLRTKLRYEPIGFELLPDYFTLTELYDVYCTILDVKLDRRNFSRKINSYGLLNETQYKTKGHVGRRSKLYEFNISKFNELKSGENFYFEI